MGRQHTTWISDETWERLKDIPGDSTSERLRNAVKFADPNEGMRLKAIERQAKTMRTILNRINSEILNQDDIVGSDILMNRLEVLMNANEWLWNQ